MCLTEILNRFIVHCLGDADFASLHEGFRVLGLLFQALVKSLECKIRLILFIKCDGFVKEQSCVVVQI
jgi:hypothetical protein